MMNPAQEGAYVRLLCYCWRSEYCGLRDNRDYLFALSRLEEHGSDGEQWFDWVQQQFEPHPEREGFVTNPRLLAERQKQDRHSEEQSKKGVKSGEARRNKSNQCSTGHDGAAEPNTNSSSSTSSSIKTPPYPPSLDVDYFRESWQEWLAYKRERRDKFGPRGQAAALKKLEAWGPDKACAAIRHSMANGWAGIFEEKPSDRQAQGRMPISERDRRNFEAADERAVRNVAELERQLALDAQRQA